MDALNQLPRGGSSSSRRPYGKARAMVGWLAAGAIASTAVLQGCGTKVDTPLPDIKTKAAIPEGGVKPKSAAEQKKAIDDLMAKRDAP